MRQVGVSCNTAWSVKHKVMQAMEERDGGKPPGGLVRLDDVCWGGGRHGGKRGRGPESKAPSVAAVALHEDRHPVAMNLQAVKGFRPDEIARRAKKRLLPGGLACPDGPACFAAATQADRLHASIVTGGGPHSATREEFAWVDTLIGNVRNAIHGSHHAIDPRHLPRYLAEFCYRFNRRFDLRAMMPRFLHAAVRTPPMPARLLKLAEAYG